MSSAEDVRQLALADIPDTAIAKRLNLSVSRVSVLRQQAGIRRYSRFHPTEEVIAEIRQRSEEGWPPGEIAETLGVSLQTVRVFGSAKENGKEWNKVARWCSANHYRLYWELRS